MLNLQCWQTDGADKKKAENVQGEIQGLCEKHLVTAQSFQNLLMHFQACFSIS